MKTFGCVFILLMLYACKQPAPQNDKKTKVQFITGPVAVVITPSDKVINKMKKENSEDDFNTILDDNGYYLSQSETYLDSIKVRKITHSSEGTISFKTNSGRIFKMKLDSMFFGVMLFNGKDKPIDADMTDIGADYKRYMSK